MTGNNKSKTDNLGRVLERLMDENFLMFFSVVLSGFILLLLFVIISIALYGVPLLLPVAYVAYRVKQEMSDDK